ncbi:MAG: response regulator [Bryobacterales bacterium]|nr:response regulator [Bryobacterales bacterium]
MSAKSPMQSTILLLTSEPLARLVLQEVLERAGYLVMATGDLGTAVDRMRECKPDLLIISPYVETITGHDAAKYLQSRCLTMRILMVAGLVDDKRLEYRAELEKVEIFPRPFTGSELLEKVRELLSAPKTQGTPW